MKTILIIGIILVVVIILFFIGKWDAKQIRRAEKDLKKAIDEDEQLTEYFIRKAHPELRGLYLERKKNGG
ncbi:MAG TPA: hypothetical protein ENH82_03155 [bacterium]|nr:hypothetical protein [bacterium]